MRLSKKFVLKQVAVVAGLVGAGTLLSLPAMATSLSNQQGMTIAQSSGGGASGSSDGDGSAYENAPDSQTMPDAGAGERNDSDTNTTPSTNDGTSGSSSDEGVGSGQGGADYNNEVNPANPDSTGGEAYERVPGTQPLPDANQQSDDSGTMNNQSGTTDSEGTGSGQGGYNNPVNPANPDPTGGEAYERAPGTQPLPDANQQSGDSTSNDSTQPGGYSQPSGTTTDQGAGGGQGGNSNAVRGLW